LTQAIEKSYKSLRLLAKEVASKIGESVEDLIWYYTVKGTIAELRELEPTSEKESKITLEQIKAKKRIIDEQQILDELNEANKEYEKYLRIKNKLKVLGF